MYEIVFFIGQVTAVCGYVSNELGGLPKGICIMEAGLAQGELFHKRYSWEIDVDFMVTTGRRMPAVTSSI